MKAHYRDWDYKGSHPVWQVANLLYQARRAPSRLAPMILMTDPARMADPIEAVRGLPRGAAVIYRHFGAEDRLDVARHIRDLSFKRELQFLIGQDPELAIQVGADGVHFRRDTEPGLIALWRRRLPDWIMTQAAPKGMNKRTNKGVNIYDKGLGDNLASLSLGQLDGLFLSSIFKSESPSAGSALGLARLKTLCDLYPVPIFALGGVTAQTAPSLIGSGAAGLAGVSGILKR